MGTRNFSTPKFMKEQYQVFAEDPDFIEMLCHDIEKELEKKGYKFYAAKTTRSLGKDKHYLGTKELATENDQIVVSCVAFAEIGYYEGVQLDCTFDVEVGNVHQYAEYHDELPTVEQLEYDIKNNWILLDEPLTAKQVKEKIDELADKLRTELEEIYKEFADR